MSKSRNERRSHTGSRTRRVRLFPEENRAQRPAHIGRVITMAGLEQARLEAAARADNEAALHPEGDHA